MDLKTQVDVNGIRGLRLSQDLFGKSRTEVMNHEERTALIEKYVAGYQEVSEALENFPAEKLTARLIPGKWTAAEIVHHLADSEMTSAIRLRKLLSEDFPVIYGYDQDLYTSRMRYNERPLEPALEAFRAARSTTRQLLEIMSEEEWQRKGWHSEHGLYTIEMWLRIYAAHGHEHAAQIRRLRDAATIDN